MLKELRKELKSNANPERAKVNQWFFKTGKGQYGEGDKFLGLTMPALRKIAKKYVALSLEDVRTLLYKEYHEERMAGLLVLVYKYKNSSDKEKEKIAKFYLKHAKRVNNWDLVDVTAPYIVGDYLFDKDKKILYKFARSSNLWERRIAIISTFHFIKQNEFDDTLKISEILLHDEHDLIHKAVGWMLREVGKRDQKVEEKFLETYHKVMPRTMLRYSIEKFSPEKRKYYMKK